MNVGYCTWLVAFEGAYGYTPDSTLRERGFKAAGVLHLEPFKILGFVQTGADLSDLDAFDIKMISSEEALSMALAVDASASLNQDGELVLTPLTKESI
jgi:hypothetical protein